MNSHQIPELRRLFNIWKEMNNLIDEAKTIVRHLGDSIERAEFEGYVSGHIEAALGSDNYSNMSSLKEMLEDWGVDVDEANGDDNYFDNLAEQWATEEEVENEEEVEKDE